MSNSSVSEEILRLEYVSKLLDGYVMLVLIIIGTIGNLLNIILFIRLKTLRQLSNSIFLLTFFLSNLSLLWSSRFPRCILTITGIDLLVGSIVYCKIRWLFARWGYNMSFVCICLSSIDRFLNTSHNQRYRHLITRKRALIITILISLTYLGICLPDAIYYSGYKCTASSKDRFIYQIFITYFNITMSNSIPVIILGIFSLLTWSNLWYRTSNRRNNVQEQVNRMMIVEFTTVFLSSLPNCIFNIYSQISQSMIKSELRLAQETLWRYIGVTLSFTLNISTFYIYFIMSSAFRRNLKLILCCKKPNQVLQQQIQLQSIKTTRQIPTKTVLDK